MDTVQGETRTVISEARCSICGQPAFEPNFTTDGYLCMKHAEMKIYFWRLQKRGDALTVGNLIEYMRRVQRPVSFAIDEAPALFREMQSRGLPVTGMLTGHSK
jgi:hypothetical protein